MRTELKVYSSSVYYNVDLFDSEPLPLTKEIKDLNEPGQSQSDFTKTIKAPGTQNNHKLFSNIFDVNSNVVNTSATNFNTDFNPNLKADCILYKDGIPVLRGYLQLIDIEILDEYEVSYNLIVIGRNANLFQDLGDLLLTDLDLSAYNHVWNGTNIEASWTAPVGSGYVYPLIDRGYNVNERTYYYDETFPAIYVKTIIDRIFTEAGYRYSSSFFDSDRFKRLIIPFTGDKFKMTETDVEKRLFELSFTADTAFITATPTPQLVAFDEIVQNSNPTGITASKWTIPAGYLGNYTFRAELDLTCKYTLAATIAFPQVRFVSSIILNRGGVYSYIKTYDETFLWANSIVQNATKDFKVTFQSDINNYQDGDIIYLEWTCELYSPTIGYTLLDVKFKSDSAFFNSTDGVYNLGQTIILRDALPAQVKQYDFISSIIKMFNLYFEPDKIDDKKLIIEPRDDFYLSDVVDLSTKLDVSRDVRLTPMGALNFRTFEMHYQKDEDELNEYHNKRYANEYGFKKIEVNNDFLVETKSTEIIFAPTPLADSVNNGRVISKIRYINADGTLKRQAAKPRILYYGGLKDTNFGTYLLGSHLSPTVRTQFAYAGHLDDVDTQGFDLSFGLPEMIYYGAGFNPTLKNNQLYNLYWKKTIDEITDKNSKLLTAYFHLSNVDLQNISFRKLYLINRQYYRLHKIETDLNSNEPALCTFLKLKTAHSFTSSSGRANGGLGSIGDDILPDLVYYNDLEFKNKQRELIYNTQTYDSAQLLEAKSQFIYTDSDIYLPAPSAAFDFTTQKSMEIKVYNYAATQITIYDTINSVQVELSSKSTAILSSNGETWSVSVGSASETGSALITETSTNITVTPESQIVKCTETITVTLPPAAQWVSNGRSIIIRVNNATTTGNKVVTVDADGTETINGVETQTILKGDSMSIYSDGSNLFII